MLTPYDWQEGIGHRAGYVEAKLEQAAPILAVSLDAGILMLTRRRQGRKLFEIYDRLVFGAIGLQSDVEQVRMGALEFASREGFARSEQDVNIQRVVTAISAPLKRGFGDFSTSPIVLRAFFAEMGERAEDDKYFTVDYDGDYAEATRAMAIAGRHELADRLTGELLKVPKDSDLATAREQLERIWAGIEDDSAEMWANLVPEAALMDRSPEREDRFRIL